jgi:hypothetical protein
MSKKKKLKDRMINILTIDRNEEQYKTYRNFSEAVKKTATTMNKLALSIKVTFLGE